MSWLAPTLETVCTATTQRDPSASPEVEFNYIDISSVDKNQKRVATTQRLLGANAPSRARKEVHAGDVLVSTVRPNLNAIALVPEELDRHIASTGFCVLRADQDLVDPKWIYYRCQTPDFIADLVSQMRGGNYPAVSDSVVKSSKIPLPTPSEQRRIVELLEQADALRRQRTEADALAERILPALFRKMFGEPDHNPCGWPTELFEHTCNDVTAGHKRTQRNGYLPRGSYPIVDQGQELIAGFTEDAGALYSGVLPVIAFGDHTRIFKFVDFPFGIGADGLRLLQPLPQFHPHFYFWQLKLLTIPSAGYSRHYKFLRDKRLMHPPEDLQAAFERSATYFDKLALDQRGVAAQIETLFQTMLHRAFTGELTARWREGRMRELVEEMELQSRHLASHTVAAA